MKLIGYLRRIDCGTHENVFDKVAEYEVSTVAPMFPVVLSKLMFSMGDLYWRMEE